jgi:succinate dehydrogenase / fumarate reductase iron-sulfur subunit
MSKAAKKVDVVKIDPASIAKQKIQTEQLEREFVVEVYRFDPDKDEKPYMKSYKINTKDFDGKMLLNAMSYIKDHLDDSFSFRRSCSEGVCGSDGMNINGKNGLACITQLADMPSKIVLRPLPGLPVIRDLVVDMTQFFRQYEKVKPYLQNDNPLPAKERLQSPEQREKLDGLYECILCACCSTSCPSFWWNPDKFLGPAALLQANRFVQDSRDTATIERLQALDDPFSLFRCRGIMNCVSVCPKGLNPTKAIAELRGKLLSQQV